MWDWFIIWPLFQPQTPELYKPIRDERFGMVLQFGLILFIRLGHLCFDGAVGLFGQGLP